MTGDELSPKDKVKQKLLPLIGKPITNKATGITALIYTKQINEMISNRAVNKSVDNGFTQAQHLKAVENIKTLYENARLISVDPDRKKKHEGEGLKSVKRFYCDTSVEDDDATVKITVKESFQHGHRIYSVELLELNKPAELENRAETDSSAGSEDSTQKGNMSSSHYAEEPSAENIPQSEQDGKAEITKNKVPIEELKKAFGKLTKWNKDYFTKADFERGEYLNPFTNKKMPGFVITRRLPRKEYDYLESIAKNEYGVYWFPEVKAFLAPDSQKMEDLIDYLTGNYKGLPESYPIYQARGNGEIRRALSKVYDIGTYNSYLEEMNWIDAQKHVIGIINELAKAGKLERVGKHRK